MTAPIHDGSPVADLYNARADAVDAIMAAPYTTDAMARTLHAIDTIILARGLRPVYRRMAVTSRMVDAGIDPTSASTLAARKVAADVADGSIDYPTSWAH